MRITLIGFGLLAGSVAAAVKQAKLQTAIRVVSSKGTLQKAKELCVADDFFEYAEINSWLPDSDLILLCGPIKHILSQIEILKNNAGLISKTIVVSDIGSTKEEICTAGFSLPAPFCFVGGHPMAGSEKNGFEHSDPSIFENAYWLYCLPENLTELPKNLSELLHFLGSRPVQISPQEHDLAMAWLSHAPQLLSTSIAAGILPEAKNHLHLAGRGFRDMTRIASSPWSMWKDILETNKKNITKALESYSEKASEIKTKLATEQFSELENNFLYGNQTRYHLETAKNYAYPLYEIVVHIPDEPGSILKALAPLAENNINIRDIELMKVREGIGGTLLLAFKAENDANNAIKILESEGVYAHKRRI
ncbi:MAG: prephenate dehydrogenase/arogenate dehydrogenase family protein [Fibromonadaceae bacterium]|jgi:prephenate dehydrogenase|nr:prephenate dehydrogenase/arogenate dehydrogenase family protein [Fibromonadaceae bacterium]